MSESINQVTLALELIVTFSGVFLAFMLDRVIDWRKEQQAKKELLKNLSCELNELKNSLTKDAPKLYPDIWDSAVASGQLELLDSEQLTKLTNVYRKIKGTDYEGTRVRDAKDAFEETSSPDARKHYSIQSQAHEKRIEETKALIDEVLNEPWLKSL
ncbi:MAG: hypothetical protein ABSC20_11690 [Candidatus Bathyarchaeia archaeon]|jgi:hypothetical protein